MAQTNEDRFGLPEVDHQLIEDIEDLVSKKEMGMVLNIVLDLHYADLAMLIERLEKEEAQQLFDWLPPNQRADVLLELDYPLRTVLLDEMETSEIVEMVDEMDTDDAADVLSELSDELTEEVLTSLEDAEEVRGLLQFGEDSAGRLMATELVSAPQHWTVGEATEEVRRLAEEVEPIYLVYVLDDEGILQGLVTLKQLLLNPAQTTLKAIMETEIISVQPEMDQEEAARIMEKYDLTVLPVVDANGKLIGRITIDDVVDVIREEAEEDLQRLSGISFGDEEIGDSVLAVSRGRLPWLLFGLTGSLISAFVIGNFTAILEQVVILAMFIPVIGSTAGNVGVQCAAIAVQGIASGDIWASDILKRLLKEISVAFINAIALAMVIGCVMLVLKLSGWGEMAGADLLRLFETVGISLLTCILMAASIGSGAPLLLHRHGIDPAKATGPFVTTSNDIIGVMIYFSIAQFMYFR
ncbi:MAG TPA: magnesium transporter [Rhodothermales bacterium]|nr:magnesium transporter [Anaerolineae bacterium]HRK73259.1 magnesium transporter [Rhodothermales bacterium]HRR08848.1 magnesium transporter [Rhodothermales bacterium]